jgi:hypothetical protein
MLFRHQLVYDYELYQISIHFPAFQHLASPLPILPYLSEKAQLQPDFFDRLRGAPIRFVWELPFLFTFQNATCMNSATQQRITASGT